MIVNCEVLVEIVIENWNKEYIVICLLYWKKKWDFKFVRNGFLEFKFNYKLKVGIFWIIFKKIINVIFLKLFMILY